MCWTEYQIGFQPEGGGGQPITPYGEGNRLNQRYSAGHSDLVWLFPLGQGLGAEVAPTQLTFSVPLCQHFSQAVFSGYLPTRQSCMIWRANAGGR